MTSLLIRADANVQMGTGHVMRCLALAQAWQQTSGRVFLATAMVTPALVNWLVAEEVALIHLTTSPGSLDDTAQTATMAHQVEAAWVVVDGYHFTAAYQQTLKAAGIKLLCVDDYGHADHYYADLILNQNPNANKSLYTHCEPYTHLLLGSRYALLRREFWLWQGWRHEISPVASKVLVTLGGSDSDNVTLKVLQALLQVNVEPLEVVIVVGGSNPHYDTLQAALRANRPKLNIRLERNVTNMPQLMAWADVAISAGGSTCWELAFMGLPILTLALAENQRAIAAGLDQAGIALNLGWHVQASPAQIADRLQKLLVDVDLRRQMSQQGQALVDGRGSERVVQALQLPAEVISEQAFKPVSG